MMSEEAEAGVCDEAFETEEGDVEPYLEEGESTRELLERLKELEAENSALALANESQREAYERCLDEVANHVVQALLNQKDLREECIKLKMRVFDLERQNRALTELFHQKMQSQANPIQQMQCGPHQDHAEPLPNDPDKFHESQNETQAKNNVERSRDSVPGPRGPVISMEALSPFFKKKAHILEVLRRLEETDPLKFQPASGLPSCCPFAPPLVPAEMPLVSQPHRCQSFADRDVQGIVNDEDHSLERDKCQPCLMHSQKNLSKFHQAGKTSQPRTAQKSHLLAWEEAPGTSAQSTDFQTAVALADGTSKFCTPSMSVEDSGLPASERNDRSSEPSQLMGDDSYLYSVMKDIAQNGSTLDQPEELKAGIPHEDKCCDKRSSIAASSQCAAPLEERDSLPLDENLKNMSTTAVQSFSTGELLGTEENYFTVTSEVVNLKNSLYATTSNMPVPGVTDHTQAAYCEQESRPQMCNGLYLSSKDDPSLKTTAVESYCLAPVSDLDNTAQEPSPEKASLALSPTSPPCLSEARTSPVSSPSKLLRFLKIPSVGERTQAGSPLRLSPQLTRNSKIPCRNNHYEVYHSPAMARKATTTEREKQRQPSASKTDSYPGTHSAPTSPPKAEDTCLSVAKDYVFGSHSAPKASRSTKLTLASQPQKAYQKVPHYENISDLSTPLPATESSGQETYTESTVWYQIHNHHSLPNTSVLHKGQNSCVYSSVKEKSHDRGGPDPASQTIDSGKKGDPPPVPKKQAAGKASGESSRLPFKERLAALGKLKSAEDLQVGLQLVEERDAQSSDSKGPAHSSTEKSRTAERQSDRAPVEHKHTKHTGSLDGKSYPRSNIGGYALKFPGPCLPYEPGAKSLPPNSSITKAELETFSSRVYVAKAEGSKMKAVVTSSNPDPPQVLRNYMKCAASHSVPHSVRTAPCPQSSPTKVLSKSPSRPGQASSYPRGTKLVLEDRSAAQRHLSRSEDRSRLTAGKKKIICAESLPPPPPRPVEVMEEKRPYVPGPRSAIEQKVMKGIEENVLKLQEQDRGQAAEVKQKASNGIASWFGLRKSKLPALSRKPETSKAKDDKKEWKLNMSSVGKDPKCDAKKKLEVESLNISKLMEKAEDLRRALEEERAFVNGVALDRPGRGHSCEVVMDQAQGQLSVMYRGVASDNFMQQLLNRVDEKDATSFGLAHRRLSFDSKKSRPIFSHHRNGIISHTKSSEEMEKSAHLVSKDVTSEESLAESINSQRFAGSGASTHTLDSGIGTFPLPDYTGSAAGKSIPKVKARGERDPSVSRWKPEPGTKVPRKARTLERELSSLEEGPPKDKEQDPSTLYSSALQGKGSAAALSSAIQAGRDSTQPLPLRPS
ncbi:nck-associated protein 5-like isoform X1 [Scleropages formosus]|uniref:NCK-associated protein 5-like n=1 Tax=Scleropages formosus TaxID=113540 RepID=A0A8C9RGA5_SCLFO|nr:nck-associated protein 5-like isoform X1 [Scleropages formosus]XP_029102090.1 nck-associated protein 5-like isoform X1 [Scleropages formosus]XP_029102091.1 nck-associated protein 5-like isoform X1 [Scleropages formosus]XP_029102092.1 nck-associated protein 5-like isoform X1 [Scleropages formosus]XP_029102094.1 nck-associated protein 5-like isoform X1 [Scleropages formosus]